MRCNDALEKVELCGFMMFDSSVVLRGTEFSVNKEIVTRLQWTVRPPRDLILWSQG